MEKIIIQSRIKTAAVAGPKVRAAILGPRFTSHPINRDKPMAVSVRRGRPSRSPLRAGKRSAMKVTMAAMLTRKVRVYSMKVMPALTLTAQPPNSSSLRPLPPEPSVTHCITRRYMADTTAMVSTASHTAPPKTTRAAPETTTRLKKGPNTYSGEVAGSPPPASAPSKGFFSLWEMRAMMLSFQKTKPDNTDDPARHLAKRYLIVY
ncbi:MAG: hypothetical protein Q7U53_13960 [Anaerolineaceae bacterium]|nr:hypothetical protein [Anaerolineaceae bacterium]